MRRLPALALALCLVGSCGGGTARPDPYIPVTGDPVSGRAAIIEQGCGSCHSIPGIPNANSLVGPPLDSWPHRSFIVGTLTNSPDNLALWIAAPQQVRPGSAMPDLELDEDTVADIVAYLFTLD